VGGQGGTIGSKRERFRRGGENKEQKGAKQEGNDLPKMPIRKFGATGTHKGIGKFQKRGTTKGKKEREKKGKAAIWDHQERKKKECEEKGGGIGARRGGRGRGGGAR